jgi:hypothetical protein
MELRGWLRSLGPLIEVLGPKKLRSAMSEDAAALRRLYATSPSSSRPHPEGGPVPATARLARALCHSGAALEAAPLPSDCGRLRRR